MKDKLNQQITESFTFDHALTPDEVKKVYKITEKGSNKVKNQLQSGKISIDEAYKKVTVHVSNNTGKYEWYTPKKFIDAAKEVMGSIDLDPASSEIANKIIQATKIYTEQDNGLIHSWNGNIWMNPPYNNSLVNDFTKKLVDELPNIDQACILVNNATETKWFQYIFNTCNAICFVKGRIKFLDINGETTGSSLQGQVIMYFGKNTQKFINNFSPFGKICLTKIE
jgi:ParB family chromosome partitioning protein